MTLRDLLLGGPGHDGYAFRADTYCVACGQDIIRDLYAREGAPDYPASHDSEHWPQPIFFGESPDCAQHCAECGGYLYGEDSEPEPAPALPDPPWLAAFTAAYVECALWSSTGDDDRPLDESTDPDDLPPETLAALTDDCRDFALSLPRLLAGIVAGDPARAGMDLWLTRNRHGAGFWDGPYPDPAGSLLTDLAHQAGSRDLYIGDDGHVYVQ